MPAVSKKQARFLRSVAAGDAKAPGLTKSKAHEMVAGHKTRNLPERKMPATQKRSAKETMEKVALQKVRDAARKPAKKAKPKAKPERTKNVADEITGRKEGFARLLRKFGLTSNKKSKK